MRVRCVDNYNSWNVRLAIELKEIFPNKKFLGCCKAGFLPDDIFFVFYFYNCLVTIYVVVCFIITVGSVTFIVFELAMYLRTLNGDLFIKLHVFINFEILTILLQEFQLSSKELPNQFHVSNFSNNIKLLELFY